MGIGLMDVLEHRAVQEGTEGECGGIIQESVLKGEWAVVSLCWKEKSFTTFPPVDCLGT